MLEILIVEDNATKQLEIEKALEGTGHEITAVRSIAAAYRVLAVGLFDLIILDMTFQVSGAKGVEKEPLAGLEILQFVSNRRYSTPIIVATQHSSFSNPNMDGVDTIEELDALLADVFPRNYRTTIEIDLSEDAWKAALRDAVIAILNEGS